MKTTKPKLVYGHGINDASHYITDCPFYRSWKSMLRRCYSKGFLEKCPTYVGCWVCPEWLSFSNYKAWMEEQDWRGMALNKSILVPGNKLYSADTCVFVSKGLNQILLNTESRNGPWPKGVYRPKKDGSFMARVRIYDEDTYLGRFKTPELAGDAYVRAKVCYIRNVAATQASPICEALHRHADLLEAGQ